MFRVNHITQDLCFYENADASGEQEANDERWNAISLLRGVSEGRMICYPVRKYEPLRAELEAFVRSVVEDEPVPVDGEDGLMALRLAHALVRSGREGRPITFE
jgi:UDP-N-acetylglucosamine 3-dehydrogenase